MMDVFMGIRHPCFDVVAWTRDASRVETPGMFDFMKPTRCLAASAANTISHPACIAPRPHPLNPAKRSDALCMVCDPMVLSCTRQVGSRATNAWNMRRSRRTAVSYFLPFFPSGPPASPAAAFASILASYSVSALVVLFCGVLYGLAGGCGMKAARLELTRGADWRRLGGGSGTC